VRSTAADPQETPVSLFPPRTRDSHGIAFFHENWETKMKGFRFGSTEGSFYILPGKNGWEASFGNETLGAFASPQQAADDLARGVCCPHLSEADTSTLEIPEKIADWEIVHI
jgi:hypothetical protein